MAETVWQPAELEPLPGSRRYIWWILAGIGLGICLAAAYYMRPRPLVIQPLPGYLTDYHLLIDEYRRYYNAPLRNDSTQRDFASATTFMGEHEYQRAVSHLERVAQVAAVPVVWNNLGVLYFQLGDRTHASDAFSKALARDKNYVATKENLVRLKMALANRDLPVNHEVERNDTPVLANPVRLEETVEGDIAARERDTDSFAFDAPEGVRDILEVEVTPHDKLLLPGLRVNSGEGRRMGVDATARTPGETLTERFSPSPGATVVLQIWGSQGTGGAYAFRVRPIHAFDAYEPNDDFPQATRMQLGQAIQANLMDAGDVDYYVFTTGNQSTATIDLQNHTPEFIPQISKFGPHREKFSANPQADRAGLAIRHQMQVDPKTTYYLRVSSRLDTSGKYTLRVE
jgi:hypothetical protein